MASVLNASTVLNDLQYAWRQICKAPAYAITAVLTLALAIGAMVSMFSLVDAVLLKPLSYRQSGQLVAVWERVGFIARLYPLNGPNPRHAAMWRKAATDFDSFSLLQAGAAGASRDGKLPGYVGTVRPSQTCAFWACSQLWVATSRRTKVGRTEPSSVGTCGRSCSVAIRRCLGKACTLGHLGCRLSVCCRESLIFPMQGNCRLSGRRKSCLLLKC